MVIVWKEQPRTIAHNNTIFGGGEQEEDEDRNDDGNENPSVWTPIAHLRASDTQDIYDLAWSPDSGYIVVGLTDNTAQVWDVAGKMIRVLRDHGHFVQGVAWDPLAGQFVATQSSDRSVKVWQTSSSKRSKSTVNNKNSPALQFTSATKIARVPTSGASLFLDESLVSFFRRLTFSPDGSLLFIPAGCTYGDEQSQQQTRSCSFYILPRSQMQSDQQQQILLSIEGFERGVIGIRCNPRLFPLNNQTSSPFNLPYRIVYAVLSQDTIAIFDTSSLRPRFICTGFHYGSLTDATWYKNKKIFIMFIFFFRSPDGMHLIVSATDGFCSLLTLSPDDLDGEPLEGTAEIIADLQRSLNISPLVSKVTMPTSSIVSAAVVENVLPVKRRIQPITINE